jgi:uncharacterized repeat protein (TIGR04052 family)
MRVEEGLGAVEDALRAGDRHALRAAKAALRAALEASPRLDPLLAAAARPHFEGDVQQDAPLRAKLDAWAAAAPPRSARAWALCTDASGEGHVLELIADLVPGEGAVWTPEAVARDTALAVQVAVAAALGAEAPWQDGAVALLDFEDATGGCEGSGPTNTALAVSGPAGPWAGLRFTVGVPFDLNHADAATAGAPLNTSAMFWSWASGYKFLKFDGSTAGMPGGLALHLGSTGCAADASGAVTDCAHPNRAVIELVGPIDPETSVVTLDLAALLDGMDLESNTPDTAPGCMSAPNDPECAGPFAQLGLPFGDASPAGQRAFSIR